MRRHPDKVLDKKGDVPKMRLFLKNAGASAGGNKDQLRKSIMQQALQLSI